MTAVEILFVEDSEMDVELALRALRREGIEPDVRVVASEAALREALAAAPPAIVLSDFSMPGFDGMRALAVVREAAPEVPFIFVSGTIGEERAIEAIRRGATDYVLKNSMRRLATAVRRALDEAADRAMRRAVEEERARLVEILEATSDYVGMSDAQGRALYLNAAGRRLVGSSEDVYPAWARRIIEDEARPAAQRDGTWQGETAMLAADGSEVPMSQVLIAHRHADGSLRALSTVARDISERKAYEARIEYHANFDVLTDLPNRRLLADRTAQAIMHTRRTRRPCALLAVNPDRFKMVNDSYGHAAGDALISAIAGRLLGAVREGDTVARLGADAFCVLAADLSREDDAHQVAAKLREAMRAPFSLEGRDMHLTVSVGASVYPRDGEDFGRLLRNADAAMHRVKAAGGDGVQLYAAAMTQEITERIELGNDLRGALQRRELEMHLQPQVSLEGLRIVGVEALARWRHPVRGPVSPALFIPIAEETDLIIGLGEWMLAEACRVAKGWDAQKFAPLRMAVNVSARQFRSPGFAELVSGTLRRADLAPERLELELTESILVDDESIAILESLKATGVQIAVDDFGTGYSSLRYLSRLPADCLKIDRSFVTDAPAGGRDGSIAQAIISLAHSMGMRVLAEGVETAGQREFLRLHGCNEAQGYLFARPGAPEAVAPLVARGTLPAS